MDMEAGKTLTNEEVIRELLDLCLAAHVSKGLKSRIRPVVGRI